jgi:DNA-binding HxlR family transcriptional regulator
MDIKLVNKFREAYQIGLIAQKNFDIIAFLSKYRSQNVNSIMIYLRIEHSSCSQMLSEMKSIGWVQDERSGKEIYYSLTNKAVNDLHILQKIGKFANN